MCVSLDYCNSLLFGLPQVRIKTLQRMQNTDARLCAHCQNVVTSHMCLNVFIGCGSTIVSSTTFCLSRLELFMVLRQNIWQSWQMCTNHTMQRGHAMTYFWIYQNVATMGMGNSKIMKVYHQMFGAVTKHTKH